MKTLLLSVSLALVSGAVACPAKPTLFNGAVPATIYGFRPYCSTEGVKLARDFYKGYLDLGASVNYVEGYKFYASDDEAINKSLNAMDQMLKSIGYLYVNQGEGEYTTQYVYRKQNTLTRGMIISVERGENFSIFVITNGEFPFLKDE